MIYRVNVCHFKTGVCLHECIWEWPESSTTRNGSTTGICNLVLTFYKFARELGGGEFSHALFDTEAGKPSPGSGSGVMSSARGGHPPGSDLSTSIRLSCKRNDLVVVALFHDVADSADSVLECGEEACTAFTSRFESNVREIEGDLHALVDEKEEPQLTTEDVLVRFRDFKEDLEKVVGKHFSAQPTATTTSMNTSAAAASSDLVPVDEDVDGTRDDDDE
eukprot:TRINITY_DN3091_c0_g3_i1.p2 TRINITY_DN3091_c0_g3~~TRINITY_DN3091_c0_g3_i1.p2  ORF type:complete len:220 (-),score=70.01 TRINITY_DN3091_c0_g3_i1:264-923(-)